MKEEKEKELLEKISEQVEKQIKTIDTAGVHPGNIEYLYKLIDVHKDIANEEYWKTKKEDIKMRYKAYGEGNYGRYEENKYGRRGVRGTGRGRYRGEELMDEMAYHYGNYSEGGQYGAKSETVEALEYMMEATAEFIKMLKEEAKSPEELQIIKHYSKKISEM